MYRVELKGLLINTNKMQKLIVPNVPCGVESTSGSHNSLIFFLTRVPNVPCGVESYYVLLASFLLLTVFVPNVPCGVERKN